MNQEKHRRIDFSDVRLYAVSPEPKDTASFLTTVEGLLKGGVDAVQLRAKQMTDRAFVELGKAVKMRCQKADALFIIDNRVDIALAVDADGLHVGHEDLPVSFVRELFGHRKIVGVSAHSLPEAIEAQRNGADYVSCGPLWATPTKPTYPAVGLGLIGLYNAALRVPYVAIGGIDQTNIDQVVAAGAKTVAIVRALFNAPNPEQAAKEFKQKLQKEILV